jgi:hypothetical protein
MQIIIGSWIKFIIALCFPVKITCLLELGGEGIGGPGIEVSEIVLSE